MSKKAQILNDGTIVGNDVKKEDGSMVEKTSEVVNVTADNKESDRKPQSGAKQTTPVKRGRKPRSAKTATGTEQKPQNGAGKATTSKKPRKAQNGVKSATGTEQPTEKEPQNGSNLKQKSSSKKIEAHTNEQHDEQREANHDMLQRLIDMQSEMTETMNAIRHDMAETKEILMNLKKEDNRMKSNGAPASTSASTNNITTTTTSTEDRLHRWLNHMRERINVPRWLYLAMAALLLLMLLVMALSNPPFKPERVATTVIAQNGVAVSGDITMNMYQDRYSTNGPDAEISLGRSLISINIQGDEPDVDERIKINSDVDVEVAPDQVEVSELNK